MSYLVLARKYRPKQFAELVGQSHVANTLLNAFKQNKVGQAYLFTGTRGVGKTSAARIFAKALRCENPDAAPGGKNRGIPCDKCASCEEINNGNSLDVLEIDGASNNGVDNVREIRENVKFMPSRGHMKVYIIDEVHMLTGAAFNALLKTLEEPPAHVAFILATTEIQKIPATILSRCQRFDFKRVPQAVIFDFLVRITQKENIKAEPSALRIIARKGDGSMRDTLSTLDQVLALAGTDLNQQKVTESLGIVGTNFLAHILGSLFQNKLLDALKLVQEAFESGVEMKQLSIELAETLRRALLIKMNATEAMLEISPEEKVEISKAVENTSPESIQAAFRIFTQSIDEIARSPLPKASLEMALARVSNIGNLSSVAELLQKLSELEKKNLNPSSVAPSAPQPQPVTTTSPQAPAPNSTPASPQPFTWKEFVAEVTTHKPPLGALLEHAVPLEGTHTWQMHNAITLGFKESQNFYMMQAQNKTNVELLEKTAQHFTGKKLTVKFEKIAEKSPEKAAQAPVVTSISDTEQKQNKDQLEELKEKFLQKEIVKDTKEIFGAELTKFDIDK